MPASRLKIDLDKYARIGAEIEAAKHAAALVDLAAHFPLLKGSIAPTLNRIFPEILGPDHQMYKALRADVRVDPKVLLKHALKAHSATVEKALMRSDVGGLDKITPAWTSTKRPKLTDAGRASLSRSMKRRWRAVKKAGGASLAGKAGK